MSDGMKPRYFVRNYVRKIADIKSWYLRTIDKVKPVLAICGFANKWQIWASSQQEIILSKVDDNADSTIASKVKVKLSLCFNWAPRHEGVLGSGV